MKPRFAVRRRSSQIVHELPEAGVCRIRVLGSSYWLHDAAELHSYEASAYPDVRSVHNRPD